MIKPLRKKAGNFFGLQISDVIFLLFISCALAFCLTIFLQEMSLWVLIGAWFFIFITGHMMMMTQRCLIFPELIGFIACLSLIVAPWLSYRYPPSFTLYEMSLTLDDYLSYAVPAVIVLWLGVHVPLRLKMRHEIADKVQPLTFSERNFMDALILFGLIMQPLSDKMPASLRFLGYVLSNLRFVGALSFMYTQTKGWQWRVGVVCAMLFVHTAKEAIFYELIIWCAFFLISLAYIQKWRWRFLAALLVTIWAVTALNVIKMEYRTEIQLREYTTTKKLILLGKIARGYFFGSREYKFRTEIGDRLVRWNQGWIVSRVMNTVPEIEPYAKGKTVTDGIMASITPRLLNPRKISAGSRDFFEKYTDLKLSKGTSMGLGISGEMYANFGYKGIVGIFIYGLIIGYIFSRFARLANANPLWWAWLPFLMLSSLVAEWEVHQILNHIIKSLLVMVPTLYLVPFFRNKLLKKSLPGVS